MFYISIGIACLNEYHIIPYTEVKNYCGDSALDIAVKKNKLDVSLYLISCGCGNDEDKGKVLVEACRSGKLQVVKKLVEKHEVNPNGNELYDMIMVV